MSIAVLLVAIILIVCLPRKYVIVPFLLAGSLIPIYENFLGFGLNFHFDRILLLVAWARILVRREPGSGRLSSLDKVVLFGALVNSLAYCIVWPQLGAMLNRAGFLLSGLGTYFLMRSLIRDKEDVIRVIKVLAIVVIVCAPLMWSEHVSQHNAFASVGSPEQSEIRNGRIRAEGPFAHPIIAGTFGVVLVPLFIGLWWYSPSNRLIAAAGAASSTVMMFASASSTPVMALPAGILALSLWPVRKKMRTLRWGIVLGLIGLQLAMRRPIWFLMARVSGVLGGSGYHRSELIDDFVSHFFGWWLVGTKDNVNWGWSMWDVDNAYVGAGLTGGLLGFILFIAVFVCCYKLIGEGIRAAGQSRRDELFIWAIGAAFFANTVAFFGIVYFDQSRMAWNLCWQ